MATQHLFFFRKFWCAENNAGKCIALAVLLCVCSVPALAEAGTRTTHTQGKATRTVSKKKTAQPPAASWQFSGSGQSKELWEKGMSSGSLQNKAVVRHTPQRQQAARTPSAQVTDNSVSSAERKGGLRVSWQKDDVFWQAEPPAAELRVDEGRALNTRHVVRAQASSGNGNTQVSFGPEFTVKDKDMTAPLAQDKNSPDTTVGMGLQFLFSF